MLLFRTPSIEKENSVSTSGLSNPVSVNVRKTPDQLVVSFPKFSMTEPAISSAEMQKLLEKLGSTKPVAERVRCESKNGVVASAKNPDWPPHRKGECTAEDYGEWIYEELPKLLSYIRTLEREHRAMREAIEQTMQEGFSLDSMYRKPESPSIPGKPPKRALIFFWRSTAKLGKVLSTLSIK